MVKVAGHIFDTSSLDAQCSNVKNGDRCWMTRSKLFMATTQDIGKPDFACAPNLTASEFQEIQEEIKLHDKRTEAMMAAIRELSG